MVQPLHTLLQNVIHQEHSWKIKLLQEWHTIFGNLSTFVQIEKIEEETLVLGVSNSCWLQEFYLLSPLLLKTINEKLVNAPIKQLRFKLRGTKHRPLQHLERAPRKKQKQVELNVSEQKALERIQDPELRVALERFLIRCYQE